MAIPKKGGMTPSDDPEMRQAILDQGPTPILAVDRDYNIIFMNLTGCRK